jgi:hypothetical protein
MRYAVFALVLAAAPAAAQDAAVAVVKKAIDAHGGTAALNQTRTARAKTEGTLTLAGGVGEVKFVSAAVYALPDKFKLEMAAEVRGLKMTALQLVNGGSIKVKSTLAGVDTPQDEKSVKETFQAVLLQDITTLTPLVAEGNKYTLKAEPDAGDKAVVLVSGNQSRDVRLYFDKTTGLLHKTVRRALVPTEKNMLVEVTEESVLSDFKKNGAALLPTKVVVTHDGKKFMDVTITETKFADKIDPAEFETK